MGLVKLKDGSAVNGAVLIATTMTLCEVNTMKYGAIFELYKLCVDPNYHVTRQNFICLSQFNLINGDEAHPKVSKVIRAIVINSIRPNKHNYDVHFIDPVKSNL